MRGMQSILAKSMKDSVVRGCLLQLLYERRSEGSIPFGQGEQAEAGVASPISISIDKSRRTTVPRRQQTSTAPSTPQQQQVIMEALEKVITAINQADVSEQEKNEAKSLLRKLLGSKAAASVLGPGAHSLAAKYFAG